MNNYCQSPQRSDVHQVLGIHDLKVWNQKAPLEQRFKDLESGASVSKNYLNVFQTNF